MAKENILTFMDQMIDQYIADQYDIAIDWHTRNHQIEVFFRLFAENKQSALITDLNETTASDIIEFEDSLLFYQPQTAINEADYLVTFSFDRKQGIAKKELAAVFKTLRFILDEGQSDLLDFVTDEDKMDFELQWQPTVYLEALKECEALYGDQKVTYPKY